LTSGFAFFQYLIPSLVLGGLALAHFRKGTLDRQSHNLYLALAMAAGACVSLLVRPAGAQTTYWLYLLPPLFAGAIAGYRLLITQIGKSFSSIVCVLSIAPLIYAWALFIYGQPRGLTFGGHGGVRVIQTQVEQVLPTVRALSSNPAFVPRRSRVLLWDISWQIFYFSQAIPASSILTNETWNYSIDRAWQEGELRNKLETSADFVITAKSPIPSWMEDTLQRNFVWIWNGEYQNIYLRATVNHKQDVNR
jgi:hypothetical protein